MAMETRIGKMKVRALALAVEGVLLAMCAMPAHADDAEAAALKLPTNYVEFGALSASRDSAKFGEYTGLNKSGGYLIGNFGVRGGDAYGDGNGTTRWSVTGTDLGLTSRSLGATMSNQGKWNFGINFDELRHFTSDSYQTPYTGNNGGNSFTLPGFGAVAPAGAGSNTRTGLSAAQLGQFHTLDISNTRVNTSLTGGVILNPQWNITLDFNHLDRTGAKLFGFGSSQIGGAATEKISILPVPLNFTTDTATVALNWLGDKGYATASYFASFFRDKTNSVTFATWSTAANPLQTMSTPPSNNLHQLNLTGGYALSNRTKLAGGLSYSRNSQNAGYAYDTASMVTPSPTSSLNGSVVTTHADLKLTDQTTKNLILSGGLKYDNRDNRTSSNIYNFIAISGGNIANYPNAPLSVRKWQAELAGDYRLDAKQKIRVAFNHDDTHRECNQYAVGGGTPAYAPGTNCVTVFSTKEDKLSATYRLKASADLNLNAGYAYSDRRSDRDLNARSPMIGLDGNATAAGIANTGGVGITGLNAGEFRGFNPFFEASRKQNLLKAGANWQASDRLSVGLGGRYTNDDYDTTYGMQKGHTWSLNLDSTYNYREDGAISFYVSQQERTRDMTNDQRSPLSAASPASATAVLIPSGATWSNSMKSTDVTIGVNVKQGGLMAGKLDLAGDLSYSLAKTGYGTVLNYSTTTSAPGLLTCADPSIFTCVPLPDIRSAMLQFKLSASYKVDKSSKIALGYLYRRLNADDYYYNTLQTGLTPISVLPTNQTAPNYSVNVVWASYMYTFQ
jgi:MtrB/PioB family decaheme-associated outer membrane protein